MIENIIDFIAIVFSYFDEIYNAFAIEGALFKVYERSDGFYFTISGTDFFFIVFLIFFAVLFFKFLKWFVIKLFSLLSRKIKKEFKK